MSVRKEFADMLAADWASIPELANVRVIATERALDDVTEATALIRTEAIARADEAPNSHRNYRVRLTFISQHFDLDNAADELDVLVSAALDYLDRRFKHDEATAVGYGDRLAFDIPVTILAAKTAPETEV